jgi:DNA-binding NarL/FixJ family response regulator
MDKQKQTVFVVDDHPLVREWLANLINQQPDIKVCGEAGGAVEAINSWIFPWRDDRALI